MTQTTQAHPIPTALYIHIPWCIKKCPYCDFNSHTTERNIPEDDYLQALLNDLDQDLHHPPIQQLESIFIGGGTPSLLSGAFYSKLLSAIEKRVRFKESIEITLEANPGTTEATQFKQYRAAGINRLSLGIQSFNNEHLERLGRIHSAEEASHAIHQASQADFHQINLDLMFGLPNQSVAEAITDLEQALRFETTHLSWYQLTLEPNTVFFRQQPVLPREEAMADMYEAGQALLASHRFQQYEISAYCKAQLHCQHNLNYWEFGDYLGIGAGAHGKISSLQPCGTKPLNITRYQKTRLPNDYLKHFRTPQSPATPTGSGKKVSEVPLRDHTFEFLLNALRLRAGFPLSLANARAQLTLHDLQSAIPEAFTQDLLQHRDQDIVPTELGWNHINTILEMLV